MEDAWQEPSVETKERIAKLTLSKPVSWRPIRRGYTTAERYVVGLEDGRSIFVKLAPDKITAGWLRDEQRAYAFLKEEYIPELIAWEDGEHPLLVLEDLSGGHWPPPWSSEHIAKVFEVLDKMRNKVMPADFMPLDDSGMNGWRMIAQDPSGFLALGLASSAWLERALPLLVEAESKANYRGDSLVHTDVRSDNICFAGDRTLLVDWNWARRGNSMLDTVVWLPSLHIEGGPPPWSFNIEEPELIAAAAGFYAYNGHQPESFKGAAAIRGLQRKLLTSLLPWVSKSLGLPEPE